MKIVSNLIKRVAEITQEFRDNYMGNPTEKVWTSPGTGKFVSVLRRGTDESNFWYYAQRKGKDSVAFLLHDSSRDGDNYLTLEQYNGSHDIFTRGAFTGSIDKPGLTVPEIVIEEVFEEAGFQVTPDRVIHLTSDVMGTSTDETVHMYIVDVTGLEHIGKNPENVWEENTNLIWTKPKVIADGNEIKAKSILLAHILKED